jgi:hypothetical protein
VATRRTPATFDNVARVPALRPSVLDRRYLRKGRPVILTGLCDHAPIRRLADLRAAQAVLGDLELPIRADPVLSLLHGREDLLNGRVQRFEDYLDAAVAGRTRDGCIEHDTPEPLERCFPDIPYLDLGERDDGWVSHMFLAPPGASTHLHYDADKRNVVTYQVFGRKRYVLIDPAQTRKLAPGGPPAVCYASALHLQNFHADDLRAFLRYVDAWDCILGPGETLVTPSGFWHYVEYVDVALSVTFRLPRNPYVRFLASELPATSVELQALAACFRYEDAVGPAEAAAFRELHEVATRRYPSAEARGAALDILCVELCERLDLPISRPPYHLADIERRDRMASGALALPSTDPALRPELGGELRDLGVVQPQARRRDVLL